MANEKVFADKIADLCHKYFENVIPAKGKPQLGKEWTVLSAIVKDNSLNSVAGDGDNVLNSVTGDKGNVLNSVFEVVALGTGTKCLGQSEESADGDLVHDSHAEVVAKRAFVLYLVRMTLHISSLFLIKQSKFVLSTLNVQRLNVQFPLI